MVLTSNGLSLPSTKTSISSADMVLTSNGVGLPSTIPQSHQQIWYLLQMV